MIDWIHELTEKDRESFLAFCKRAVSPIQIYLYARFLGFTGSIVQCDEWSKENYKKRDFGGVLEAEIDAMTMDISKLRDGIDMGDDQTGHGSITYCDDAKGTAGHHQAVER